MQVTEEAIRMRRAYQRRYRATHKKEISEYNKKYFEENKERLIEYKKDYAKKNRQKLNAYAREWAKENREKIKQYNANYWQKKVDKSMSQIDIPEIDDIVVPEPLDFDFSILDEREENE